ncbi:TnsA-like heteromeric transposase endonuclease subunit [Deinococcus aestuarii]|uniref:TnsA-like heteromeric transposase endonuclease subunit n=1 Tax=Deinococcus aestuarii TaxID=2774531 RepID=UPI001C0D18D0|nr:TnsA-like heteromeric transposase endonuclease subunit [Deinococcus aestuarii]
MVDLLGVTYLTHTGVLVEDAPITDLHSVPVDALAPVRVPRSYKGQPHLGGRYLFAGTGEHVLFESRLEQDALRFLDHGRAATHVAAQPLLLKFRVEGKKFGHYPDFLVDRRPERHLLLNVRTTAYLNTLKAHRAFSAARALADALGWAYQTWSEAPTAQNLNLRFLGGYRFPPYAFDDLAPRLLRACDGPTRLGDLCGRVSPEALARPVVFHLLWRQDLQADLTRPLSNATLVHPARES